MKIEKDRVISIHYIMEDEDGKTLENTIETGPGEFLVGHSQLMPAIEDALADKESGAEVMVNLAPDQAFGQKREDLIEQVDRSKFSNDMQFEIGHQFEVPGPDGHPEAIRVVALNDSQVTFDRNHPLAGKSLKFSVTVREVREATPLEIEHGHPMNDDGGCGCDH
ncbi:MAG: peptidylprolyl isomerase [Opitutales bacterium]